MFVYDDVRSQTVMSDNVPSVLIVGKVPLLIMSGCPTAQKATCCGV